MALLTPRVEDEHPRVRLEAVRVLAHIPTQESANIAMRALDKPVDTFLDYALWLTARELAPVWLPGVQAGTFDFDGHPRRLVFALQAEGSAQVLKPLLSLYRAGRVPDEQDAAALNLITAVGGPNELALVLDLVERETSLPSSRRATLLNALVRASRDRKVIPSGDLSAVVRCSTSRTTRSAPAAASAAGAWKIAGLGPKLVELAKDDTARRTSVEQPSERCWGSATPNRPAWSKRWPIERSERRQGDGAGGAGGSQPSSGRTEASPRWLADLKLNDAAAGATGRRCGSSNARTARPLLAKAVASREARTGPRQALHP